MALTEGSIDVAGTGKALDTTVVTTGEGSVHREAVFLADPEKPKHRNRVDRNGNAAVSFGDSAGIDAFSRLRVSNPVTLFESIQRYGDDLQKWESKYVGTAPAFSAADSGVLLSTGGITDGNYAVRMSRQHIRYQAGKSMLWLETFRMGAHLTGVQTNVGAAMTNGTTTVRNAIVFRRGTDGTLYFVVISDTSGTPTSAMVGQTSWNLDTLDGSGDEYNPSGIELVVANTPQILVFDLQWLGVGRVRCGFDIGGKIVWAHEFNHANDPAFSTVYMRTAALASYWNVRNQIETAVPTGTQGTLLHICTAVLAEGDTDSIGSTYQFGSGNGTASVAVTTRRPVFSLRAKTTGPNSVRNTGLLLPTAAEIIASTNSAFIEIVLGATLSGASFSAVDAAYSLAEKDTSASSFSGGIIIGTGYAVAGAGGTNGSIAQNRFSKDLALVYTSLNNVQDTLTIVATSMSGTSNVAAAVNWDEAGI